MEEDECTSNKGSRARTIKISNGDHCALILEMGRGECQGIARESLVFLYLIHYLFALPSCRFQVVLFTFSLASLTDPPILTPLSYPNMSKQAQMLGWSGQWVKVSNQCPG